MAGDNEAVGLSRVHMYESMCILPLRDRCLFWIYILGSVFSCPFNILNTSILSAPSIFASPVLLDHISSILPCIQYSR